MEEQSQSIKIKDNEGIEIELTPEDKQKIANYKSQIDLSSTSKLIQYGLASQNQANSFSTEVLKHVKSKDLGPAHDILINLKDNLGSIDNAVNKKSLFPFFDSIKKKISRIKSEYSKAEKNIISIEIQLEKHYQTLLKDVNIFDKLFIQNQTYFKEISLYILAGDEKVKEMKETVLPQMRTEAEASNDQSKLQAYKDTEQQVNRFEKKIHDLKLTRMVILQSAPQIRMIQNNSSILMEKIQTTIVNTLPLWRNQMVLTLGIAHNQQALEAQKAVTDATNELLRKNSEMLKDSTIKIAAENERGVIDIETIQKTNSDIISTIDEVLRIQQEGREKRLAAEQELLNAEHELKSRLLGSDNNNGDRLIINQ